MKKLFIALAGLAILLASCSKKPTPEVAPTEPSSSSVMASSSSSVVAEKAPESGVDNEAIEGQRLEGVRSQLEDLMNRLMASEIYFEYDKAVLTDKAKELLVQAGDILKKEAKLYVEVQGHTDERGAEAYNMALGSRRAQSVVKYLVDYGVMDSRLKSVSFGEEAPKVQGTDEEAYAQNRRAAFKVKIGK